MLSFTLVWTTLQGTLSGLNGTLVTLAYSILVVTLLLGIYQAFLGGASLRGFAVVIVKFAVASAIISNWSTFFTDVSMFGTSLGQALLNGNIDMFTTWWAQIQTIFTSQSNWPSLMLSFGFTAIYSIIALACAVVSVLVMAVAFKILGIAYAFWGGVLYCLGPLLIALAPSGLVSDMTSAYSRKLAEWALWPALYALFVTLMNAANLSSLTSAAQTAANTTTLVGGVSPNSSLDQAMAASIYCLLYGIVMLALPFVAHYVIGGNFAGAAMGAYTIVKQAAGAMSGGMTSAASAASTPTPVGGGSDGGGYSSSSSSSGQGGGAGRYSGSQHASTPPPPTPAEA